MGTGGGKGRMSMAGGGVARGAPSGFADAPLRRRQVRRAWALLTAAFAIFTVLCGAVGGAGYWYRGHATVKQRARVEVVQGDRASVLPALQVRWSALPAAPPGQCPEGGVRGAAPLATANYLEEGDALQTGDGTRVLLTLWDGSTVEVFERSQVRITELRTTQYISRASAFSMEQSRGLVRVALAPGAGDYSRARFQVSAGDTTALMKEGGDSTGGVFLVEVTPGAGGEAIAAVRASVRRGEGTVRVAGRGTEVRLRANEQTIVPAGGPPGPPTPSRRDLVANGTFTPVEAEGAAGAGAPKQPFAPWTTNVTPGQGAGGFGQIKAVAETIDDRPVGAVEFSRSLNSVDHAITGLRQSLNVSVSELAALELTADVKVLEQNLPGGGEAGSEFPLIVRVNYRDAGCGPQVRTWGFYAVPGPGGAAPPNGRLVPAGKWERLTVDLRALTPPPERLESIEVYASGHGYRARVTNVAIVGAEVGRGGAGPE